jgi:hypothetical protein
MPFFADLSGTPVVSARLCVPYSGIWHADVVLDRVLPTPLAGPQVLTLSGSVWACSVVRVGSFAGSRSVRLVGGLGGWRRPVLAAELPPPLISPIGVPVGIVVLLAAGLAAEPPPNIAGYDGPPLLGQAPLGGSYVFQSGPMSQVLQGLFGGTWYMDPTGAVQVVRIRPPTPILSPWTCVAFDGASGIYEIATDAPGDWMPGASFVGPTVSGTISRVTHELSSGKLRTHVMGPPS